MLLTEQNLEYVLESVIEALQNEEIEIDEELLDECLEEVLSEISSGLARRYLKKAKGSEGDREKHDKEATHKWHNSPEYQKIKNGPFPDDVSKGTPDQKAAFSNPEWNEVKRITRKNVRRHDKYGKYPKLARAKLVGDKVKVPTNK